MLIGLSLEVSYKLFAGLLLAAIFFSLFYCVYRMTRDLYAALTASAVFLFSNQVMGSFYYTFSLGTSTALVFFPLAVCGMYLFLEREEKPFLLGIGFTGLLYSHVLSTFLAVIVCFILLLIYVKKLFHNPGRIGLLFLTVLTVSALSASFWMPMLEQFLAQPLRLSEPWTWVDDNVLLLSRLIHTEGFGWTLTILVLLTGFFEFCPPRTVPALVIIRSWPPKSSFVFSTVSGSYCICSRYAVNSGRFSALFSNFSSFRTVCWYPPLS